MLETHIARTTARAPKDAAAELAAGIVADDARIALVFCSSSYDTTELAASLQEAMGEIPVVGCTTAGEICGAGFSEGAAVAMSISEARMRVGVGMSAKLGSSPLTAGREAALEACARLGVAPEELKQNRHVAVCLVDGRSGKEESFIAGAASAIPSVGIVGGSASDELDGPPRTRILANGKAHSGCGLIMLFETSVPFSVIVSEHVVPTDNKVVVTDSDPATRTVHELNGRPAVEVYEELIDSPIDSHTAARHPFAQYLGGRAYIRSVMEVQGTSLRFACAVENGVILRLVEPGDLVARTRESLTQAAIDVGGEIAGLVAFHCLGRFFEAEAAGKTAELAGAIGRYPVVGFNTFGEQAGALHVNYTLTALAFGRDLRG